MEKKELSAEDIKSEKEKLMPSKGAILNVTKENLQLTSDKNDSYEVLFHDVFKLNPSRRW